MLIILAIALYAFLFTFRKSSKDPYENQNVFDMDGRPVGKGINNFFNKEIIKNALFQIGILGSIVFVVIGINYIINTYELLYSPRGVAFGASYTDVNVMLWVYRIMAVVAIVSAFIFLNGIREKSIKRAIIGPLLLITISIIGNLGSGLVQRFIVEPNEISKERKYLEYNIDFTQKAYGLNMVEEKEFPVDQDL